MLRIFVAAGFDQFHHSLGSNAHHLIAKPKSCTLLLDPCRRLYLEQPLIRAIRRGEAEAESIDR